ncbi:hypothetical protein FGADI_1898 [Fusarium gaditjirri]|uniref:Uncharacterized protein n=1 Tax=Fusarium gaditjirri TaxID=282569 RepID=A0A8H4TJG8_9HYPO|nr:hypothetical protein FGADI_1898 [Fusarium gaditjirri]
MARGPPACVASRVPVSRLCSNGLMAHDQGIKLLVSIHTHNRIKNNSNFYGQWHGTGDFYTNSKAISQFKDRFVHVLAHKHHDTDKTWAQNEAMRPQGNPQALDLWQYTMAKSIKQSLNGNLKILATTGYGAYLDNFPLDSYLTCDSLNVLAIHAYGVAELTASRLNAFFDEAN